MIITSNSIFFFYGKYVYKRKGELSIPGFQEVFRPLDEQGRKQAEGDLGP